MLKKVFFFCLIEADCSNKNARKGTVRAEENPVSEKCKQSANSLSILALALTL